jgi:hypothetical protein
LIRPSTAVIREDEWLQGLAAKFGSKALEGAERAIRWLRDNGFEIEQTRSQDSLAAKMLREDGKPIWPFFVRRSTGRFDIALQNLAYLPAYSADSARRILLERIKVIPTNTVKTTEKLNGWPSIALEEILKDEVWTALRSLASDIKAAIERSG